jgi:2-amino-4-hydroxy-6-hydroxymethyldihydropteridine diphosphokinase
MELVFLSIGSNTGDRVYYITESLKAIETEIGTIVRMSDIYETQAWGYSGLDFLNMVVLVETSLIPEQVLGIIKRIEAELGRVKKSDEYADRTIDLDILFFESQIFIGEKLIIPHPQLQNRLFVLVPLNEIAPDFLHPVFLKPIKQLLAECNDSGWIRKTDFR